MYQIPGLLRFPKLFHAFSTKADGNMSNSILGKVVDFEKVLKNRKKFLKRVKVDINKCACMWVSHKDEVVKLQGRDLGVSMKDPGKVTKVDGLMISERGTYLFLLVADCLPIIFYDSKREVISLVHAGWKGVDLEIARKAVEKMQADFGTNPKDIIVGIGPHARKESFIKESPAQKDDPRWENFLTETGDNRYEVDLLGFTKKQLLEAGVVKNNIYVSDIDTVKDISFFSHVREKGLPIKKQGRFACVVGLV